VNMTTIQEIMTTRVVGVAPDDSLAKARNLMLRHRIGRLAVLEEGNPVGIVTRKDLASRLVQAKPDWRRRPIDHIPVRLVMTAEPITIHPTATVKQVAILMRDNDISGLLVMDKKLKGVISKNDLVEYFSRTDSTAKVGDVIRPTYATVHLQHSLNHVVETMDVHGVDRVIVVDGNRPAGMVTRDSLAFITLSATGKRVERTRRGNRNVHMVRGPPLLTAEDLMSSPLVCTTSDEKATTAAAVLIKEELNEMPVLDEGEIRGVFTMKAVVHHLAEGLP